MEVASLFLLVTVILWLVFGHFFDRKEYLHFKGRKSRKVKHRHSESVSEMKEQPS